MKPAAALSGCMFVLALCLVPGAATAEEPAKPADEAKDPNIELKATEITESLNNIVGSYKLEQMEIVGSNDQPQFNYILRWQDPVPFPDEKETVSGSLTKPYDSPMDREEYRKMLKITTDK
jgi:hypothetical protein